MRWKFAALVLFLAVSPAFGKSLYWRALDVNARLDADGRLHVREQQAMVFDGDWNGGERRFNLRQGQVLDFKGMSRVEDGREIELTRGDLSRVDHWDFAGANIIRWRSRLPGNAPFRNQELIYVLDYVLSNILDQSGGRVHLQHDFAFPDRAGVIKSYSLHLELDPAWEGLKSPLDTHRQNLAPGQSMVIVANLTYAGAGKPAAIHVSPSRLQLLFLPILMLLAGALLTLYFYWNEVQKGRFAPLFPQALINDQWLQRYVFSLPPEAVGAAWDEKTGAPEVCAIIARMAQEKKLTTWVTEESHLLGTIQILHLRLNVDWNTLPGGEKELIEALFLGKLETDTKAIAAYYRNTGFRPESLIRGSIDLTLGMVPEWSKPERAVTTGEIFVGLFAFVCGFVALRNKADGLDVLLLLAGMVIMLGLVIAVGVRHSAERLMTTMSPIFAWLILIVVGMACYLGAELEVSSLFLVPAAFGGVALAALILLVSRSRDSVTKLAFRRRLAAARAFFKSQLRLPHPRLRDEWYPYLVALGLGGDVDHWFRSFSGATSSTSNWSGSSSGSSSSSWTGGGGAFGGAGASGSWAAMSALGGGVAAPGSSGGGGGGGGGGGSGGGGGW